MLGDTPAHRAFWRLLDRLAEVFWRASRRGVKLPVRGLADAIRAARAVGPGGLLLVRYLGWTVADALRAHGLENDRPLVGLLAMLVEDTVHGSVAEAPLINAALGITIRGAGLTRPRGGMRGFWQRFDRPLPRTWWRAARRLPRGAGRGSRECCIVSRPVAVIVTAGQVVAAVPAALAARLGPGCGRRSTGALPPPRCRRAWAGPRSFSSAFPSRRSPARPSRTTSCCTTTPGRWATATTCSSPCPPRVTPRVLRPGTAP